MPGSPSTPLHSNPVRLAYALVAMLVGITGGLGNALFSANLAAIQGGWQADAIHASEEHPVPLKHIKRDH